MAPLHVYTVPLNSDGLPSLKYMRLPPPGTEGYTLRFVLPLGSNVGENATLYINYPTEEFVGGVFEDRFSDVKIHRHVGAFQYYLELDVSSTRMPPRVHLPTASQQRIGYFVVEPIMFIERASGSSSTTSTESLGLDGVVLQSVVPKWLGPLSQWPRQMANAATLGYNLIHYAPMQARGQSNSPYSLYDQLALSNDLFTDQPDLTSEEERWQALERVLKQIETEYGVLAVADVVLNHTADNSPWLHEHPESGYNLENSPHLIPAYELDEALLQLSAELSSVYHAPSDLKSEDDLQAVMRVIQEQVLPKLKLWEYYIIDVDRAVHNNSVLSIPLPDNLVQQAMADQASLFTKLAVQDDHPGVRFGKEVNMNAAIPFVLALCADAAIHNEQMLAPGGGWPKDIVDKACDKLKEIVNAVNLPFYKTCDADMAAVITNVTNTLRYERLDVHGPKRGAISRDNPLITTYFTRLPLNDVTSVHSKEARVLANNGWIWGGNPLQDFASSGSSAYLRRDVIYTKRMATYFQGFRLDNCHSTPLPLAEHVLDAARTVRPNLYVTAEIDITFVSRLGIHSLVRESMRADDVRELSRLVHRYGGIPIGSFDEESRCIKGTIENEQGEQPRAPHAIFMDCTHDNETPQQRRTIEDTLPNAAVVSMACCATLFPKLLDLVQEQRHYRILSNPLAEGIGHLKQKLQLLHAKMAHDGCNEIFVHQENQYILATTHAHAYFKGFDTHSYMAPTVLRGTKVKTLFSGRIQVTGEEPPVSAIELWGIPAEIVDVAPLTIEEGQDDHGQWTNIVMLETNVEHVNGLEEFISAKADEPMHNLSPIDEEEQDTTPGNDVYHIPNYGTLPYCGLEGFMSVLRSVISNNDLGHPLCDHVRSGRWALDYIVIVLSGKHADAYPALKPLHQWFTERVTRIKQAPDFLMPKLFSLLVRTAYYAAVERASYQMTSMVHKSELAKSLALCSLQMVGKVPSTGLRPTSSDACLAAGLTHFTVRHMRCWGRDTFIALHGLLVATGRFDVAREHILAFAENVRHGLIPNLLDSARKPRYNARDAAWWFTQAVKDYCKAAPEGVDLLQVVVRRRFPKDDCYVDPSSDEAYVSPSSLGEILHEICQRHANGIHFREWNAGPNLDHAMQEAGFQIDIDTDLDTGLVKGGNIWNCGTWMDKMGDSHKAGNYGQPATPRDGAPIEITGLIKSTVTWLSELHEQGKFAHKGVIISRQGMTPKLFSYKTWSQCIQDSFERHFYVPLNPADDHKYVIDTSLVNRRGIYKDTYGGSKSYADYQFRPNFAVAMVVAPELFDAQHAQQVLWQAQEHLLGPIGMRTLDPADWAYRGNYNNADDSEDRNIAHGFNYHQGPEWVWCTGYFLRALALFDTGASMSSKVGTVINQALRNFSDAVKTNAFAGLPELTNANGSHCADSCATQAWSAGTILSLLDQLTPKKCQF
ncbi:amylo-alpha-1,6-glucosidase-domain-containing protein [Syncephalis plumigaleata]|nr:amylo-alpha-1,6-glucosidase-domain-containing protein [Syncephalis plumigaleata]